MSSVSLMEFNAKPSLQWDWENLTMFNVATADNPKRTSTTVWGIDGEKGFDSGSFCSSGGASGSGGAGSVFGIAPLSKSLNSASISSSSIGDGKTSKPALEGSEAIQDNFYGGKPFAKAKLGSTSVLEASVGSGEPPLGLKLGKRTYFEDVGTGSNSKSSSIPGLAISSATSTKRSKSGSQGLQAPRCQVEGCNLDLSSAKDYHRKHKVCESHSKCPKVIVAGVERRFCQQCSRFHGLSEFDEKKRSCRRRLSDHNARRRKPQSESVQLNPARMSSSYYDEKQQISFAWNGVPPAQARPKANHTWEGSSGSKFTLTKEYLPKPPKIGGIDVQLHLPDSQLTSTIHMHGQNTNGLLSCRAKGTTSAVLNQDLEESIITSNLDANQDLHRALSLLSTNSWGLSESKSPHLEQPVRINQNSVPQSVLHAIPPGLPLTSLGSWRPSHQSTEAQVQTFAPANDCSNYFQEFQFPRTPYESDFYSAQMN